MTYIVGLTGGIGCGKTTVSRIFAELGASIIDTDVISYALTQSQGLAIPEITHVFGNVYIDEHGALQRALMRELVFNNAEAKTKLEAILHPLIYKAVADEIVINHDASYIILVVPLLIETQRYLNMVQRIAVVDCDEQQQISRAMARSDLNQSMVQNIMKNQISRQQRLQYADDVILNQNSMQYTQLQITQLHQFYLTQARNLHAQH